jgi:MFS family permease
MTETTDRLPLKPYFRWLVLAIMSLICFAQYFIYDSITPLGSLIKSSLSQGGLGFSGSQYGLLFSAYAVANVFLLMLLVAGVLVDKLGLKISGILYGFLCFLGAALTALGAMKGLPQLLGPVYGWLHTAFLPEWSPELKVMLLGRAIYGVGAEAILVVNNKVLARWFKGKELAFAYGLNLTIMRLGTFLALNIQAPIAKHWGLRNALWFAALLMLTGFSTYFIYLWLERKARGRAGAPRAEGRAGQPEEKFRLKEVFTFSPSFWFISLLCVTFYSAVFPFQAYAPDILVQKFGYSVTLAGSIASALIFGTMIFTPIFGWLVDRFGKRATLMLLGSLLLIPCHGPGKQAGNGFRRDRLHPECRPDALPLHRRPHLRRPYHLQERQRPKRIRGRLPQHHAHVRPAGSGRLRLLDPAQARRLSPQGGPEHRVGDARVGSSAGRKGPESGHLPEDSFLVFKAFCRFSFAFWKLGANLSA